MASVLQPLFKDVGKRVNDLLTKDFPSEKREQKAEWKSTTPEGVKLEFNIKSDSSKTVGLIKNEYFYKPYSTTLTTELTTEREVKLEASTQDKLVKGLKTILSLQSQAKKGSLEYFENIGIEYRSELFSATASAEVGRPTDNALKGSLVVGTQGVAVGTSAEYLRKESETQLKELKSSLSYASDEFDVVAYGKVTGAKEASRKTEVGATYYHKLNSDLAVGTEIKFDVSKGAESKVPTLAFGTTYAVPSGTVKAKFDTEGKLGLSYAQQVNKTAKLLLAATINTAEPSGKDGTQFGFNLTLNG